jgi:hypothetical protein
LNREVHALVKRIEKEGLAPDLRWLDEVLVSTRRPL